jgi:hypothetical protein
MTPWKEYQSIAVPHRKKRQTYPSVQADEDFLCLRPLSLCNRRPAIMVLKFLYHAHKSSGKNIQPVNIQQPITVVARSRAWTVFARWNAWIVSSNPTRGMDVCIRLFCVCVVLYVGSGLATGWSPVQGVLPTVYRIEKLKKRPRAKGLQSHREREK